MSVELRSGRSLPAGLFSSTLYRSAPPGSFVEVRFRAASGMGRRFHEVELLHRLVDTIVSVASRTDVYVGVVPRRRRGGERADLVETASVVWVDCDSSESVDALRKFRPMPAMVVSSGSGQNCHAYWFLREPVALEVVERVNRRLALTLGADLRCSDAARILRPAGSVNRKHSPPAAVRLLRRADSERVSVDDLERCLSAEPPQIAARRTRPRSPSAHDDPLDSIPPRVYFERLTGRRVERSGKAPCPFHDLSVGRAVVAGVSPACSPVDASLTERGGPSASTGHAGLSRGPSPVTSSDPLRLVPPPVYFERLTGLRVGRSGKLRCLFHDDRSPSLHVYLEPARGWYCFGCGRGGSIYDLAALLWHRETRGKDFVQLRRELEALLG